jgi:hypothetical protein
VVTNGDNCNYSYDFTLTLGADISLEDFRTHDKPFESATKLDFVLNFKARQ